MDRPSGSSKALTECTLAHERTYKHPVCVGEGVFCTGTYLREIAVSESDFCQPWRPDECEGTPTCPPRCPRFYTPTGTAVLIEPQEPADEVRTAGDLSIPNARERGPDDVLLTATVEDCVTGYVWLRPVEGGDRRTAIGVATAFSDDGLSAELARQAIAYGIADGAARLFVDDEPLFERAGFTLKTAADDESYVSLTSPVVEQVTTPPARENARSKSSEPPTAASVGRQPATLSSATAGGRDLSALFAPERIAVVGATDRDGSIGRLLLENLEDYPGDVVPITPRAASVFGRDAPDSLSAVEGVDLAVIALAPESALAALETARETGVENAIVVSAGFEEAGDDGEQYARQLREIALAGEMNVVGPNSMGVMSTASGLNASFSPRHPARGSVSLISQSGAFITASLAEAADRGMGFRHVVSVGNKTVLDAVAYLRYLDDDPETAVIAAYLEDIDNPEEFVSVAREVTRSTPVVVLKPGKTDAGASAAASHTGSLAGDDTAVEAAFERAGIVRASSSGDLFDYAAALRGTVPDGDAVGIVTNAGGPGVLAADAVAASGNDLPDLGESTRERLAELLPPTAAIGNPTDVLGDADVERFGRAIGAVLADPAVDIGLVVTTPHPLIDYDELAAIVGRYSQAHGTPVITCFMDGDLTADAKRALRRYGVANYDDPSRAAGAIDALSRYSNHRSMPAVTEPRELVDIDENAVRKILEEAREDGRQRLGVDSFDLLDACDIHVPAWDVTETPADAACVASAFDSPVVLKVASDDVAHKVDAGGVRVGVTPDAVEREATALLEDVREARPDAEVTGILVQELVETDGAVETVIGATRSEFGPLVTFGLGGILVEHVGDVAFGLGPLDYDRAHDLISAIDAASILEGVRGAAPADVDALAETLVRLCALLATAPEITAIDLNPVLAGPGGVTAVDLYVELEW